MGKATRKNRPKVQLAALVCGILLAGACLACAPQDKVARLVKDLQDANSATRVEAAMALAEMGPGANKAIPALSVAVLDRNLNVRYYAINALKAIGPPAKAALPQLIKALDTFPGGSPPLEGPERYYADARAVAAEAIGAIGPDAKDAAPALKKALEDENGDVRSAAAEALKRIEVK